MILVIGAGAVGTTLCTYLVAARQPVRLLVREQDMVKFQAAPQLIVERIAPGEPLKAPRPELSTKVDLSGVDYVFICVKYPALDDVIAQLASALPPTVTLVSALNGVGAAPRLRQRCAAVKVANMTVMFNAQLLSPLHSKLTTRPQIIIDSADSKLLALFNHSGMEVKRTQGQAIAWGKLLINLANAVCAITHSTAKQVLTEPDLRAVYAAILDEAVDLMERAEIAYRLPMPLPYQLFRQIILRGGPLPWWIAKLRNGLQEGSYPSMVADVEAGRKTEVAQLNGEIVSLGGAQKRPTPVNSAMVELVQGLEGKFPPRYLTPAELRARLTRSDRKHDRPAGHPPA